MRTMPGKTCRAVPRTVLNKGVNDDIVSLIWGTEMTLPRALWSLCRVSRRGGGGNCPPAPPPPLALGTALLCLSALQGRTKNVQVKCCSPVQAPYQQFAAPIAHLTLPLLGQYHTALVQWHFYDQWPQLVQSYVQKITGI